MRPSKTESAKANDVGMYYRPRSLVLRLLLDEESSHAPMRRKSARMDIAIVSVGQLYARHHLTVQHVLPRQRTKQAASRYESPIASAAQQAIKSVAISVSEILLLRTGRSPVRATGPPSPIPQRSKGVRSARQAGPMPPPASFPPSTGQRRMRPY